eukprot:gene15308-20630_t
MSNYNQQYNQYDKSEQYNGTTATASPVVTIQPVNVYAQPQNDPVNQRVIASRTRPPANRWGDSICDWPQNLFPSCWCACCCCYGIYLQAQMYQKINYVRFSTVIGVYIAIWILGFILQIALGGGYIVWIPMLCSFIFAIVLRIRIVQLYNITECGNNPYLGEFCCAFWCWYCSIAQMARYLYGYQKVFDGDSDVERPDGYSIQQ